MLKAVRIVKRSGAALSGTPAPAEVRSLVVALESRDGAARQNAREALAAIGKPAVPSLMQALQRPNEHVRWAAAKALGEIHDRTSGPALTVALQDASFGVRWLAAEGLVALGRHSLRPLLRALMKKADSIWLREGALHILHHLAKQGLGDETRPVVAALEGPVPAVAVPLAARDATEKLREARRRRGALKRPRSRPLARRSSRWSGGEQALGAARIGGSGILRAGEGGQSMTREQLTFLLDDNGYEIANEQPLPDGTGWQFQLASGQIIDLFDTGSWKVEGKNPDPIERLLSEHQSGIE